ncbi:tRNA (guanosine(46)-N7)-methyltransferase TrmB [Ornithinimicrobium cryptoxanthini]|uniref:tRNA (guanosine(46)-N7)-methyltransferase TrmB n=1 Tax=Ornithinimicrobium cryptoxanthini TaxID=2934161 RepID=UPI0021193462|nr:tRNA (guanosine(46)-N7)-methyltransferase TrmB [Ornithinimicrobium cryptoxanthini]
MIPEVNAPHPYLSRTRSFTRRGDRMPPRHQVAYDDLAPRYVIDVPRDGGETTVDPAFTLDVADVFGRTAPLVVEVGPGSGDALLAGAAARPDWDFLALEVWRPGIGQALMHLREQQPPNIAFVEADAAVALQTMLPEASVAEVWTFFPDPWPKRKHLRRRIVQPEFAGTVCRVLAPGGLWRLATDIGAYATHMRAVLDADERFALLSTERAPLRPVTRFERKGVAVGRAIADLAYQRR